MYHGIKEEKHQGPTRTPSDMFSETSNLTQNLILIMWTLPAGFRQGCRKGLQHLHSRKLTWKPKKGPIKTTVLLKGYCMGFHVSLGEEVYHAHGIFYGMIRPSKWISSCIQKVLKAHIWRENHVCPPL